ncbi:uncharacterized protein LOC125047009 [Penaeus chinensis]|uniref:uncharacterized protein LOC125047009 n=1 Tax=Penaeus chinensis TaxID=139456 RepID=UPI001FB578A6|nr:uncharacterized protein LOC125047009 [Penaeus chinensis]
MVPYFKPEMFPVSAQPHLRAEGTCQRMPGVSDGFARSPRRSPPARRPDSARPAAHRSRCPPDRARQAPPDLTASRPAARLTFMPHVGSETLLTLECWTSSVHAVGDASKPPIHWLDIHNPSSSDTEIFLLVSTSTKGPSGGFSRVAPSPQGHYTHTDHRTPPRHHSVNYTDAPPFLRAQRERRPWQTPTNSLSVATIAESHATKAGTALSRLRQSVAFWQSERAATLHWQGTRRDGFVPATEGKRAVSFRSRRAVAVQTLPSHKRGPPRKPSSWRHRGARVNVGRAEIFAEGETEHTHGGNIHRSLTQAALGPSLTALRGRPLL